MDVAESKAGMTYQQKVSSIEMPCNVNWASAWTNQVLALLG